MIRRFFASITVAALSVVLAFIIGIFGAYRIFGASAVGVFAVFLVPFIELCGLWLVLKVSVPLGKAFMVAGFVLFASTVLQFKFPGVFRLGGAGVDAVNRASETRAFLMETPAEVACTEPFVISTPDESRTRYWWSPKDDPIVCYDRPGRHPRYGTPLTELSGPVIELVITQRTRPTPPPPLTVTVPCPAQPAPEPATAVAWSPEETPPVP